MAEPPRAEGLLPERLAERDEAAFDRVFESYFDPLRRFVYRYVRSWDEADDLVHDLFARLWERWRDLPVDDLKSYLYTSARNRALSHLKHRAVEDRWRRSHEGPVPVADGPAPPPDPERELLAAETGAAVQRAVDALPPRQREVMLRRWAGESHERIATALGISPNTVSEHITRAMARLRDTLSDLLR
jgi:RNA polymerase sigma-70 factor (family 1)